MKDIYEIFDKMKRKTSSDLVVELIGSRISTPDEGFVFGRYLAEQSSENASEVLDSLNDIRGRCSNYINIYQTDVLSWGKSIAKKNSDRKFRKEASKLVSHIDKIRPKVLDVKYGEVA